MHKLLFFFSTLLIITAKCNVYEVEELENNSGLIIEKGQRAKLVYGHWKIVHYIDITELEKLQENLYLGILKLTERCAMQSHVLIFLSHLEILSKSLEKLRNVTAHIHDLLNSRPKRSAPFSVIGYISRALVGTLLESDLDDINRILDNHATSIQNITELIQDQTIIIKRELRNVHTTIQKMTEVYNDTTNKTIKIQNFTLHNLIKIEKLNESISILNSIYLANAFIESLKKDYYTSDCHTVCKKE